MGLFGKLVKTVVNVAEIPLAITKDVLTLGGTMNGQDETYTRQLVERIKEDADEE